MAMYDKVVINSIDVTEYRLDWLEIEEWMQAIDCCSVTLSPSVSDVISITAGMVIEITRGMVTSTDENVFTGQITQYAPQADKVVLTCKGPLYDAIKNSDVKSWDKDIDTEAGVGSEIFKTLCDNSDLLYTNSSIISTGTDDADKIVKFIQNDEDDFQKMNELAEYYNYMISYDYTSGLVNFKPKGYYEYPSTLTVGTDIQNQIKWKENMEQMVNSLKIDGATVYDKRIQTFAGPDTTFTLTYTPEDTEVRKDSTTTNTIQKRGQKGVGTLGTNFDYYVDVEQKKIVFSGATSNVWVNYGAQVPMPVALKNQTSIDTYGGPRGVPHFKKFTFTDIKDINDAIDRGMAILNKYSVPFIEAQDVQINDTTIQSFGNIKPGYLVTIVDPFKNRTDNVFVKTVTKAYPHLGDRINVGDEIWKTEDWQATQMKKINQLLSDLSKNQDILTQIINLDRDVTYQRRYSVLQINNIAGETLVWDHFTYGLWGVGDWGSVGGSGFIIGHTVYGLLGTSTLGGTSSIVTIRITQNNNTYDEYLYDDDFLDSTSTANWNTTTKQLEFDADEIILTETLSLGTAHTYFTLTLGSLTGSVLIEISGDGKTTWQTVTQNIRTAFNVSDTTGVYIRITENNSSTATIANTYTLGEYNAPAIKCILEV
jgi:hypothetical protein